jgi:hypothetical protein
VDGSAGGARHDPDDTRVHGQRALPIERENALEHESVLQVLEGLEKSAATRGPCHLPHELELSARSPNRGASSELDPRTVGDETPRTKRRRSVHHAIDDSILRLVLEAEIDVSARGWLRSRHLALHPEVSGGAFDRALQASVEIGNRMDLDVPLRSHRAARD